MKKVIVFIFLTMILFFIGSSMVSAEGKYVGTCYCVYLPSMSTLKKNCEDYHWLAEDPQVYYDEYDGICDMLCQKDGADWYNRKTLQDSLTKYNLTFDKYCDRCEPMTEETKKDCVLDKVVPTAPVTPTPPTTPVTPTPPTSENNCKYEYSKAACEALDNGTWNEETECCDLSKTCWLHIPTGFRMEGGTYYFQELSPCADENNRAKYPSQKCEKYHIPEEQCTGKGYSGDATEKEVDIIKNKGTAPKAPNPKAFPSLSCSELLGSNLTKLVRVVIKAIQIIGAIVAIVNGMITLIPAIMAKDADGLKKAEKKLMLMAIIVVCIFLLPYLVRLIGTWFDFDTSCFF